MSRPTYFLIDMGKLEVDTKSFESNVEKIPKDIKTQYVNGVFPEA